MTPVRLEPAALRSRVKHSTTEPLRSLYSSIAIILMGKRELVALLKSAWCLVMVERLFLVVLRGCLQFVVVVFPDHTHLLFLYIAKGELVSAFQIFIYL